jgi:hypothetical protein
MKAEHAGIEMSVRLVAGIVLFCVWMTGLVMGNISIYRMIGEVNRNSRRSRSFSYFGFWAGKTMSIISEYRRLYPEGKLYRQMLAGWALMIPGFIGTAVCVVIQLR